jgi:hypothetical protein
MDKTVDIRVRAHVEPVVEGGSRVQLNQSDYMDSAHYHEESFSPKRKSNTNSTSEFDKIRARAEDAFRQYSSEANRFSSSGRESENYIRSRANKDLTASELDFNRKMVDTSRDLRSGKITAKEADESVRIARETYNEDKIHTRILKDLLDTLKSTSKEQIRENSKAVQDSLSRSKTLGVLGAKGDEFELLKEKFQNDDLGSETRYSKFARYSSLASGTGRNLMSGNVGGAAMIGSQAMIESGVMSGVGVTGGVALGAGAAALAVLAAAFSANKSIPEKSRSYMLASQRGVGNFSGDFSRFSPSFDGTTTTTMEGMNFYGDMLKSSGGRTMTGNQVSGYMGLTKSREVSPELLNSILSNQRYSKGGDAMGVATTLESALEKMYPKSFRDKLVQLPEMMGVYNSLAHQMVQTTGYVNSNALSSFVGSVGRGFGVEGENLQRYSSGLMKGFSSSSNPYLRKFQFAAMRKAHPEGLDYQRNLEILENPTSDTPYMRNMYSMMKGQGLTQFRSWFSSMGLGSQEAGKAFTSGSFEEALKMMGNPNVNKASKETDYNKYFEEQKQFYGKAEVQSTALLDSVQNIERLLSEGYQKTAVSNTTGKVRGAIKGDNTSSWQFRLGNALDHMARS